MSSPSLRPSVANQSWTEAERLLTLQDYAILDTAPEQAFEDIVELAASIIGAPIALVSLVDARRQWFKARRGLEQREMDLEQSICALLLRDAGLTVVPDLAADPRFRSNALVAGGSNEPGLRFYAGATLTTANGIPLGSLCVLDTVPRPDGLTPLQASALQSLARQVMDQLELRRSLAEGARTQAALRASEARLATMFAQAIVGLCEVDPRGHYIRVNAEQCRMLDRDAEELIGSSALALTHPEDVARSQAALEQVLATREPARLLKRYLRKDGATVWAELGIVRLDDPQGRARAILVSANDLTDRIAATARLTLSEETLRLATEAAEVGTWDYELATGVLTCSDRVRSIFGLPVGETCRVEEFEDALHPDDHDSLRDAFVSALDPARRTAFDAEFRIFARSDGGLRWVAARGRGVFDAEGRCVRALGTAINVTAYRNDRQRLALSEAMLAESEAKFRAITDSIDQMVWSTRPDGYHDFYNQRWYDYTGVPAGSTDGEAWNGMFHPDDRARAWSVWHRSLATGEPYRIEYRLRHRSGQYRWVLGRAQAVRDADGRIVRWYGTCTEIEEIIQAREILARSRKELEREVARRTAERDQVWRNAQDLLLVLDGDGLCRAANPAWTRLLGWDPQDVTDAFVFDFIHPDDVADSRDAIAQALAGQLSSYENRLLHRAGGFRIVSWMMAPHAGNLYVSGRDVTQARAAEEALAATQDQLRQAQKMEAVGQLTGGIAHDFNNMLSIVIGSIDLLERRLSPDATRERRYTAAAMEGARRAAQLTQRLLAFSRQQPLQPKPIAVNELVAGMSDLLRRSLSPGIELHTVLASNLWWTNADPNQLENVLLNLAVNARDAMTEGGRMTIETANLTLFDHYSAAHAGVPAGEHVLIACTDTGTGMTPEVLARAFEPFYTTKDVGRGTGLGLSQVYGFVKQSGGHVRITSRPGQGTTVKVYLPRLVAPELPARHQPPLDNSPGGNPREVVLVVEDQPNVRQVSVEALQALGYGVLEAATADAALDLLDVHPEVVLLFTDVVMPKRNGRKLADAAVQARPGLRVLFTTGYTRDAIVHDGVLDEGVNLIVKPFTVAELAAKVRAVLDAPAGLAPEVRT